MPIESNITKPILEYLNSLPECIAEKVKGSSSASGRADINACYKGRSIRIEVKTPDHKNKASVKQEHNLNKWFKAGAVVMVVYSKKAVASFIRTIESGHTGAWTIQEENGCESWAKIPKTWVFLPLK